MLVLTRRKDQKVLFPNLGISVEVVDVCGKAVRLGIDAPRDIRIVRNELKCFDQAPVMGRMSTATGQQSSPEEYRQQLDAANLAIHLARNQLRQGRNALAEDALDQALACLQSVDRSMAESAVTAESDLTIHETRSLYKTNSSAISPTALVFSGSIAERQRIKDALQQPGRPQIHCCDEVDLVRWILQNRQPDFALMICDSSAADAFVQTCSESSCESTQSIECFGSLQRTGTVVQVAGLQAFQWRKPGLSIDPSIDLAN